MGHARGEHEDDPAGAGREVLARSSCSPAPRSAPAGGDDHEGGVLGDAAGGAEIEQLDVEVAELELVVQGGEAAGGIDVVGAERAVAGEEIDLFARRVGHVEDRGGHGLLAEEGLLLHGLDAVELVERDDAALVAAGQEDDVGLLDAGLLGLPALLVDVEVRDGDAGGAPLRGVGVLAQEPAQVAPGLGDLGILGILGEGRDDAHGQREVAQVRQGLGRERVAAVLGRGRSARRSCGRGS